MTKRRNEQKDTGEPAFSPDGRYLYFVRGRRRPGKIFEYNKDPNGQIYVIQRLDRETGDDRALRHAARAARSARRPSPDGKSPRVRPPRALQVGALREGPRVAASSARSTTASSATCRRPGRSTASTRRWRGRRTTSRIVFWAGGKISRVDVAGEAGRPTIPFHVKVDAHGRKQAAPLPDQRSPPRHCEFRRPRRMLRWVAVSPDGKRVVYQALGHLYVKDLPDGAPRRLTTQTDHFEFYPVLVARRQVDRLHDLERREARQRARRCRATRRRGPASSPTKPGHYVEPAFSPDGAKDRLPQGRRGGYLRSSSLVRRAGLYSSRRPAARPTLVTDEGSRRSSARPATACSSSRPRAAATRSHRTSASLVSITLDGADERELLTSRRRHRVRASRPTRSGSPSPSASTPTSTPFVADRHGRRRRPEEQGPAGRRRSRTTPATTCTGPATARSLYWSLGPELFTRDLKDAFAFLAGAPEKLPEPRPTGAPTSASTRRSTRPPAHVAFVGRPRRDDEGRRGHRGRRRSSSRATASTRSAARVSVPVPAGAKVDRRGRQDDHARASSTCTGTAPSAPTASSRSRTGTAYAYLAFGVTTIHDPSNDTARSSRSRAAQAGLDRRAAHLLDRHDPLRRRGRLQGRDRHLDDARRTCAA